MPDPPIGPAVLFAHLTAAKYFQVAPFVVLVYDHVITFGEEVERVWQEDFSGASLLFVINRYVTMLQFIVIIVAFNDPGWTDSACARFVAFEGSSTIGLISVCELVMMLRVYALYQRSNRILLLLGLLWVAQVTVSSVGISTGFAIPLPPGFVGCIFTGTSPLFPGIWVAPLVSNTVMFLLTLHRSRAFLRQSGIAPTLYIFVRDGTIYFMIIFMANLFNTLIYFLAEEDLKAFGASFSQLITSTMISRLVLNLRSVKDNAERANGYGPTAAMKFMTRTIGNLGEEMDTFMETSPPRHSNGSSDTYVDDVRLVDIHASQTTP